MHQALQIQPKAAWACKPSPASRNRGVGSLRSLPNSNNNASPSPPGPQVSKTQDAAKRLKEAANVQERLQLLQQLQQQSSQEETSATTSTLSHQNTRMVDANAYTASLDGQRRANVELNTANQYIRHLENEVMKRGDDLAKASSMLRKVQLEHADLKKQIEEVLMSLREKPQGEEAKSKLTELKGLLEKQESAAKEQREALQKVVPVKVPIRFNSGVRSVKLMGSFDHWTRGIDLAAPDADSGDSMQRDFETTLSLTPGTYAVKFVVDGDQWRYAPGWPVEGDNNVLQVDPLP